MELIMRDIASTVGRSMFRVSRVSKKEGDGLP